MKASRDLARLFDDAVVGVLVPVEAQLAGPLEVVRAGAAHFAQFLDNVARVHLDRDQRHRLQGTKSATQKVKPRDTLTR